MVGLPDMLGVRAEVIFSSFEEIEDIEIVPCQPSPIEGGEEITSFVRDDEFYRRDEFYPAELVTVGEPAILRDMRLAQVTVSPIQYNPATRRLRIYADIQFRLVYEGIGPNPKERTRRTISEAFLPLYRSLIPNADEILAGLEPVRGGYMIIAQPMFVDSLRALAEWKHRLGYDVTIVSTAQIDPSDHNPSQAQVFNCIRNAYRDWEVPPEYVMLVGDEDQLTMSGITDFPYSQNASDQGYTYVDGDDYLPDIFIGRLSVDNMVEFRKAVPKIFKYERDPQMFDPEHWVRGLSVGYPYFESARLYPLWARQIELQHGFVSVDTIFGYEYDPDILTYLNQGRGFVQYRGVAGADGWWGPSLDISHLNQMQNNQKMTIVVPITCALADFDDECFGEHWISMGYSPDSLKGGPSFFSSSDHSSHTKWNNPILVGFFWGLFEEGMYNMGPVSVRAKMQTYRTFPRNIEPGGWVQQYFSTYNILGDPALEMRTAVPRLLVVEHAAELPLGINHIGIDVADTAGAPVGDALVVLTKGTDSTEEVFEVARTDATGHVEMVFHATTADLLHITISGRNLYPYQGSCLMIPADVAVGFDTFFVDDDASGYSHGNGDGRANPGETIELTVRLRNFGAAQTALGVAGELAIIDGPATVYDGYRIYGDIPPAGAVSAAPFVVAIGNDAPDGDVARFRLTASDSNQHRWDSELCLPTLAPRFRVLSAVVDDFDGRLDPGDVVGLFLNIVNNGGTDAGNVVGVLTAANDFAHAAGAGISFGNIPAGDTASNAPNPFEIWLADDAFDGGSVEFELTLSANGGVQTTPPITVPVGVASADDPTGPDAYGYYIYDYRDSAYSEVPVYSWINTAPRQGGQGTRLVFTDRDDKSVLAQLPFDFKYYGQSYSSIVVSTNGFIATDTSRVDMAGNFWASFYNWPIPDPGHSAGQISPFWDDLELRTGTSTGIFTWHDTTNGQFVIEFDSLLNVNGNGQEWFEIIISDPARRPTLTGDSEILFQYRVFGNTDDYECYSSIGMEDETQTVGLQYSYDNSYALTASMLGHLRVIKISTNTGRGGIRGELTHPGGAPATGARVTVSSGQTAVAAADGSYWLKNVPPGTRSLSAVKPGYFPVAVSGIAVEANRNTDISAQTLEPCPVPDGLVAFDNQGDRISLIWYPVEHPDFIGYNVYRSRWQYQGYIRLNADPLPDRIFTDSAFPDTGTYWYHVTAVYDPVGGQTESFASNAVSGRVSRIVAVDDYVPAIPESFFLAQNFPNPFNPSTAIVFGLPKDAAVRLEVFDILGRRVRTLLSGHQRAGYKRIVWDGRDGAGRPVASGIYFYRLATDDGGFFQTRKMSLVK
jgi:hypothetical protein